MKANKWICAAMSTLLLTQTAVSPMITFAQSTSEDDTSPKWTFTMDAGNLPEDAGAPDDDLNLYVNYDYFEENQDTLDQKSALLDQADEPKEQLLKFLTEDASNGNNLNQLKIFYEQAKDFEARDQQGLSEIQPYIDRIIQSETIEDLNSALTDDDFPLEVFVNTLIGTTDLRENAAVLIFPKFLSADSIDGSRYMMDGIDTLEALINAIEESTDRMQAMQAFSKLGIISLSYNDLITFEKQYGKLACNSRYQSKSDGIDPESWSELNHFYTIEELSGLCSRFPLTAILENMGRQTAQSYSVPCEEWIQKLDELWTDENLDILKTIAAVQVIAECAPYLDSSFQTEHLMNSEEGDNDELFFMEMEYFMDNFSVLDIIKTVFPFVSDGLANYLGENKGELLDMIVGIFTGSTANPEAETTVDDTAADDTENKDEDENKWIDDQAFACCNASDTFAHLLGRTYVEQCLSSHAKERLEELTGNLVEAYRRLIARTEWLDDESQKALLEKLNAMRLNILEPEGGFISFEDLTLTETKDGGTLLGNYLTLKQYVREQENTFLGQKSMARSCWDYYSPLTQNCFYDTDSNSINIFPGFLTSFCYADNFTDEELLGGIGYVIAHEISHAFDYCGCHYDAYGVMTDCLTEDDQNDYDQILEQLAAYYDNIELANGDHQDGDKIISEAGADLCAAEAVEECARETEGIDFKALYSRMAELWASVSLNGLYRIYLSCDDHPLDYLRANVNVQMCDTFYEAFQVDEGDGMYLPEDERIRVWG